jgi:serine protease Do
MFLRHPALFTCFLLTGAALAAQQGKPLAERSSPLLRVIEPDASERELRMTPVVRAVQRSADSVVSIYLQHDLAVGSVTEGQGSGVILDEAGLVITNWHVIAPVVLADRRDTSRGIVVKLRDGRTRDAQVLSSSATRDLALLQLRLEPKETVKPVEIGRSGDLMIGETVIAIGNPQGHANTVTSGVLSATGRTIQVRAPDGVPRTYSDLLQTDAAINQGNSGGALLDITGKLIGINNAMAVGAENIGFAIPMDIVRQEFQQELIQSASLATAPDAPWLGLEVADRDNKVVIAEVMPGSPAATAGVKVGDVLARMGEREVRSSIDYLRQCVNARVQTPLQLLLRRGGHELEVAPMPITREQGLVLSALGATVDEIDAETDQALVRKATLAFYRDSGRSRVWLLPGVLRFKNVLPDSPAAAIGLKKGDVLLAFSQQSAFGDREIPLTSRGDLAHLLEQYRGKELHIAVLRGDDEVLEGRIDVRGNRGR